MSAKKKGRKQKNTLKQMKRNAQAMANVSLACQSAASAMQTAIMASQMRKCSSCKHCYVDKREAGGTIGVSSYGGDVLLSSTGGANE